MVPVQCVRCKTFHVRDQPPPTGQAWECDQCIAGERYDARPEAGWCNVGRHLASEVYVLPAFKQVVCATHLSLALARGVWPKGWP